MFQEKSVDQISIDDIAKKAGISKGLLYHYFGSKRAFYVSALRTMAAQLIEETQTSDDLHAHDRLRQGLGAYLDFVKKRAAAYRTLFTEGVGIDPEVATIITESRAALISRMLEKIGFDDPPATFRTAATAWIGAVEAASLDWLEHGDLDRDALIDLLAESLVAILTIAAEATPDLDWSVTD